MANTRPYGPAIYDAIERGDARRLESLIKQAKALDEKQGGPLSKGIRDGQSALAKLEKAQGSSKGSKSSGSKSKGKK
jgi:hypothetical protein